MVCVGCKLGQSCTISTYPGLIIVSLVSNLMLMCVPNRADTAAELAADSSRA